MHQRKKLTLGNAKEIRRFGYSITPVIAKAMAVYADERRALQGSIPTRTKIKEAAAILNQCRRDFIAAALEFEKADTLETRRVIAEMEWRFIFARNLFYEARAAWHLEQEQLPELFPSSETTGK